MVEHRAARVDGRGRAWTKEDDEFLAANHEKMTDQELCQKLDRNMSGIRNRKMKLRAQGMIGYSRRTLRERAENNGQPAPEPCPPHHYICGNMAIEKKDPGFFAAHERTEPGSGQEWQICEKCRLVRLVQYDEPLPNARRIPEVAEHYYPEPPALNKPTITTSVVKMPAVVCERFEVPSPVIDAPAATITVPSPTLVLVEPPEPDPEPEPDEDGDGDEDPELEALRGERFALQAYVEELEALIDVAKRDLVVVNLRIENHELREELARLRERVEAEKQRPA